MLLSLVEDRLVSERSKKHLLASSHLYTHTLRSLANVAWLRIGNATTLPLSIFVYHAACLASISGLFRKSVVYLRCQVARLALVGLERAAVVTGFPLSFSGSRMWKEWSLVLQCFVATISGLGLLQDYHIIP